MYILVFLTPAVVGAVWLCRARITADADGLRWCSLGQWHSARWADVRDYYEKMPQKRSSPMSSIIETTAGKLKFDASWQNSEVLRSAVITRAVNARVKEWGILGTRSEDEWPRVFDYKPRKTRRDQLILVFLMFGAMVAPLGKMPACLMQDYATDAFRWDLAGLGLWCLMMGSYLGLIYYVTVRQYRGALKRARQRFIADTSGLTLEDDSQTQWLDWNDVTDYFIAGTGHVSNLIRYVIVWKGEEIEFLPTLHEARLLANIVSRYAAAAKTKQWRRQESDVIGGASSRWSGGCEGIGERVYGYRTRTHRAFLGLLGFMALLCPLSVMIHRWVGSPVQDDVSVVLTVSVLLTAALLWCFWRYSQARIQIDARGVTHTALFGKRFLAWADIQDYFLSGDGEILLFGNVVGVDGSRIRFWTSIADVAELQEEIARRAIRCRGRAWEKKERQTALAKR